MASLRCWNVHPGSRVPSCDIIKDDGVVKVFYLFIQSFTFLSKVTILISFKPRCLPLLIGSLPSDNHRESAELIFDFTPHIPIWPQLPLFKEEGMILQYLPGFPGVTELDGKIFIDTGKTGFEAELLSFYEEYIMVSEGGADIDGSRFVLSREAAAGFYEFLQLAGENGGELVALKGQTSGPVTFCTGLVDQDGRAIFL